MLETSGCGGKAEKALVQELWLGEGVILATSLRWLCLKSESKVPLASLPIPPKVSPYLDRYKVISELIRHPA